MGLQKQGEISKVSKTLEIWTGQALSVQARPLDALFEGHFLFPMLRVPKFRENKKDLFSIPYTKHNKIVKDGALR